jgi:hypothetical protein
MLRDIGTNVPALLYLINLLVVSAPGILFLNARVQHDIIELRGEAQLQNYSFH